MRVVIAGGREFNDYELLREICDEHIFPDSEIVSGGARGTDTLGERYATETGRGLKIFPADWSKHGKGAGHIRNKQMAEYSDMLIAFWDGESKGTKNMIETSTKLGLKVLIHKY
jgi:hypothetical protein